MGILQKNMSLYSLFFSYDCTHCFKKMTNLHECDYCNKRYDENDAYFINVNQLFSSVEYNRLKEKFDLGFKSEKYRDQRMSISNPMKQEIVEKALHPDRIDKILVLTNNDWRNLENYI